MLTQRLTTSQRLLIAILAVITVSLVLVCVFSLASRDFSPASIHPTADTTHSAIFLLPTVSLPTDPVAATASPLPTLSPSPTARVWDVLPPVPPERVGLITNGDRATYKVALTFDVCQSEGDLSGYDAEIVRILTETSTPATFFLGGEWMRDHPTETLELANNPLFAIGNHSWSHRDLSSITPEEIQQEILLTQEYMFNTLGYQTNLFRLPFGTYSDTALNLLGGNGLYVIQWDVVSGDPDPNIDAPSMIDWVLQQVQPGSIIIMHANGRGWHTAEALPTIIQSIREQGYTLVTVSELLNIEPYK
jgi:peptidoglycan/xylan/chitin deacetylase (PgdA/CDA1 family)